MARGVQIGLTLNPREFLRSLKRVELATEDVADEFRDIERKGDDAFDDVERSAEDAADDIERAFTNVRRDVEDEFDRMERAADNADLDVSEGIESAAGSAKQAAGLLAGEVVDEFVENWGEAVRSGDYASAVRETLSQLGQIGGIFGPAGAVIGGGLALAATTAFDKFMNTEGKQRIKEATDGIFGNVESAELGGRKAAEAFRRGFVEESEVGQEIQQALGSDTVADAWLEVGRIAEQTGLSQETVTQALLGQQGALVEVQGALQLNQDAYERNRDAAGEVFGVDQERYLELEKQKDILNDQSSELNGLLDRTKEQKAANEAALEADRTRREVLRGMKGEAKGVADEVGKTPDPRLTNLQNSLITSADAAARINANVREIPTQKSVTVRYFSVGDAPGRAVI